jgi:RimJ/RimL family protein N-acetyltransferase
MIVYGEALRGWIEAKLDKLPEGAQFIGRLVDDKPVAVVAFHSWTGDNVEMAVVAEPGGGSRGLLNWLFGYAFDQLKCVRATARVVEDNARSIRMVERLGFIQEGRLRRAKDGKDVLIFGLLKEELSYVRRPVSPSCS